jgi:glucan biosynthesis protein
VVHSIENHPNDSRVKINKEDVSQTISSRCGTGGGNEPMVLHQSTKLCLDMMGGKIGAHHTDDDTAPTLTHGRGSANDVHAVVSTNSNGEDVMPTLTSTDLVKQVTSETDRGGGYIIHELHEC